MTRTLHLLFDAINQVNEAQELRSNLAPQIGSYFAAQRSGIFFFDQIQRDPRFQSILNLALSIEHNPIARYLTERHAPVHEGLVTSPKVWSVICPRPDHWHVMAGPIVYRGRLVGVVGCTRDQSMPGFDAENLADLSAICLHLSVWAATNRAGNCATRPFQNQSLRSARLTTRELQIVERVASGCTNAEIGAELWITENSVKQALKRMFRKLEVSSRAELVAVTRDCG
jgi:DNA-binding CsgD family transcriptional regulator